jgi:tetratricopeptide (TPR) repeat protein
LASPKSISPAQIDAELAQAARLLPTAPASAEAHARRVLAADPTHADASLILGMSLRARGDAAGARQILGPLAGRLPNWPIAQFELGLTALKLGEGRLVIHALSQAVELDPKLAFGWKALERQYAVAGYAKVADRVRANAIRALMQRPEFGQAAEALVDERFIEADRLLRAYLTDHPTDPVGLYLLAEVGIRMELLEPAADFLWRCLQLAPDFEQARAVYAGLLLRLEKGPEALAQADQLLARDPADIGYRYIKAGALEQIGEYDAALIWREGLVREFSDHPLALVRYGNLLRIVGRAAESIEAYQRALGLAPSVGAAYWGLANLKTYRFTEADVANMRNQVVRPELAEPDRAHIGFALGKAMEDAGEFSASFEAYAAGNVIRHRENPFDAVEHAKRCASLGALFTPEFLAARAGWGCQAPDPIFIVGLPRAGSTLIEQILSSHAMVEGTRELPELWEIAGELAGEAGSGEDLALIDRIRRLDRKDCVRLGEEYLRRTRIYRKTARPFFTDKMPGNYTLTGLIHLILPRAKIIDARRHPLGCGWACFRQDFGPGQPFSTDLADFGRCYRNYVHLMRHFDRALPGRVHRVIYERLVGDFEVEVRRLLSYCGLPFDEGCLRFHETERAVRTPSSEQVRQPIYASSLEQWRNFEPWLGPMKETLGPVLGAYPDVPVA